MTSDGKSGRQPKRGVQHARIGSAYFLGFFALVFLLLLWLRGAGRFLIPLLLVGAVVYGIFAFIKKVREPID
ncbi:MAG: hypothetical protein AB8H80_06260 [Planctomycetota bacterium]